MTSYSNPWEYNDSKFDSENISLDYIGFVYEITNKINQKKYIGKKLFFSKKIRFVKKKKKIEKIESDWKDYYGSSKELQEDVINLTQDNFSRKIIRICKSKGELNYFELYHQIMNNVLFRDDYYNSYVGSRIHKKHLKKVEAP